MLRRYTKYETTGEEGRNLVTGEGSRTYLHIGFCIAILTILFPADVVGQKNADFGIYAGSSYYMGDMNPGIPFVNASVAAGALYRYNFNARNSVRFSGIYHSLSGSPTGLSFNFDPAGVQDFDAKFVDLALNWEFNWKPYQSAQRKTKGSPYISVGLGYGVKVASNNPGVRSHLTLPFGVGYKLNMGRWLSAGVEAGPRRAFSDRVDGVTNPGFEDSFTLMGNRDWYMFTGLFVTYKLFKFWDDCPTYNESIPTRKRR